MLDRSISGKLKGLVLMVSALSAMYSCSKKDSNHIPSDASDYRSISTITSDYNHQQYKAKVYASAPCSVGVDSRINDSSDSTIAKPINRGYKRANDPDIMISYKKGEGNNIEVFAKVTADGCMEFKHQKK
jgi:hypothetical protein